MRPQRRLAAATPWVALVWAATVVYAVLLSAETLYAHETFRTGFDTAIYDQRLWLLSEGREPFSTVVSRPFLADHFEPALVLLTPLYWLGFGVSGILVAQSIALAMTAPALFVLARATGAEAGVAAVPAILWLASPLVATANLFDFRPATFAPVFVVLSVYAAIRERYLLFAITAIIALGTKEEYALVYAVLGVILFVQGRRRLGAAVVSGAMGCFAVGVALIRVLGDSDEWFGRRFAGDRGDSFADGLVWIARHPLQAAADVVGQIGSDVVLLVVSTGGLCLFAPVWMLLALPTLAHNALSAYEPQHSLEYHYHLPVLTAFFVAAAAGVGRARRTNRRWVQRATVTALIGAVAFAVTGGIEVHDYRSSLSSDDRAEITRVLSRVPEGEPVSAAPLLQPHLSHRGELYSLPEPFVQIDWGSPLTTDDLARRAEHVRFVVFNGTSKPNEYEGPMGRLYKFLLARGYTEIARSDIGQIVVLERRGRP